MTLGQPLIYSTETMKVLEAGRAESYASFWEIRPQRTVAATAGSPVSAGLADPEAMGVNAYEVFINLLEDELPVSDAAVCT
ncbi:MAG: hypothetical protein NZ703_02205 [Gemmataceae bacterium]|nr:hypothetical protein [Gemmataceae bacterium]MCS7269872.1 hypothetical protein [Gemmataceae bacterium]MDW8243906.1 hypothetical protein [Thermogemmata sp.]